MATDCIAQLIFRFQQKFRPVVAAFDMAHASSDGGAVLLKAIDRRLGLTERLATCVTEWREPGKVQHSIPELLRQRVFGLALDYVGHRQHAAAQQHGDRVGKAVPCYSSSHGF